MKSKSLNRIKARIKLFKNFQKVSSSISLISSIKFNRAYRKIKNIMKNVFYFLSLMRQIAQREKIDLSKFLLKTDSNNRCLLLVIASDKGLAGAFDQVIFKRTEILIKRLNDEKKKVYLGTIGKKAEKYFAKKFNLYFNFAKFENILPENFARELVIFIDSLLEEEMISEIYLVRSNLTNTGFWVEELKIFPLNLESLNNILDKILPKMKEWQSLEISSSFKWNFNYILEPTPEKLIRTILENVFLLILYALILESQASLELSRTITMKKASETAQELVGQEVLTYNKLRQQKITEELLDITRK
ncbi:MAG: F0F1 ATP synthase subunit gamma [Patescibacteria group bacterium]|nr:F0F1 ATP synthase subunit gamma [Patescibacteria group bacterium]